jgi:hypothetical protein
MPLDKLLLLVKVKVLPNPMLNANNEIIVCLQEIYCCEQVTGKTPN